MGAPFIPIFNLLFMGHLDYKNYIVEVSLKDNVSDRRFDVVHKLMPSIKEYKEFQKELLSEAPVYSEKAEEIIRFFINYKHGTYKPELWNTFEPINKEFDEMDIVQPISALAFPGGALYLKKKRSMYAFIENHTYSIIWEDGKFMTPKRVLPDYLTTIKIVFPYKKNTDYDPIIQLMVDIASVFKADNGIVYYQETKEILAKL